MFDNYIAERLAGNTISYLIQKENPIKITKVEILAKDKVVRFTFSSGMTIKTICSPEDTFSLETACYVALAKYVACGELTPQGISALAEELKYYRRANKIVEAGLKTYRRSVKEAEKAAAAEKEAKLIKERQRAKKIAYKNRKKKKKIESCTRCHEINC